MKRSRKRFLQFFLLVHALWLSAAAVISSEVGDSIATQEFQSAVAEPSAEG